MENKKIDGSITNFYNAKLMGRTSNLDKEVLGKFGNITAPLPQPKPEHATPVEQPPEPPALERQTNDPLQKPKRQTNPKTLEALERGRAIRMANVEARRKELHEIKQVVEEQHAVEFQQKKKNFAQKLKAKLNQPVVIEESDNDDSLDEEDIIPEVKPTKKKQAKRYEVVHKHVYENPPPTPVHQSGNPRVRYTQPKQPKEQPPRPINRADLFA